MNVNTHIAIDRFVLDHSELKARPDASKHQIRNVRNWMSNNNKAIQDEETGFIRKEGDLMAFVPKVKTPLRRFIERFDFIRLVWCFKENEASFETSRSLVCMLTSLFFQLNGSHYPENFASDTTSYEKSARMDKVVTCVTIGVGLAMLIGPLWWLQQITADQSNLTHRLSIITGFIVAFAILMGIVTVAKPFEVLAATAAYSAVLMVFMQLGTNGAASSFAMQS